LIASKKDTRRMNKGIGERGKGTGPIAISV
ncbi:unnamed protein product, partial [marine sediment metagenome]